MAKSLKKLSAHKLRKQGLSINTIAKELAVSKSTVSLWCKDIALSKKQQLLLQKNMIRGGHSGRLRGALVNKQKKEAAMQKADKDAAKIIRGVSGRELLFLGLGLYWGEGSKNTDNRFILVNSDPFIIRAIMKWLEEIMGVPKKLFTLQIYINEQHEYRMQAVFQYWSKELNLPLTQFRKPVFIHTVHKKIYANQETYMGVLHLYVQKSSVLKYTTMGMLGVIKKLI